MKKYALLALVMAFLGSCRLAKPVVTEQFRQVGGTHRTVAILPMAIEFNEGYKQMMAQRSPRTQGGSYWQELQQAAGVQMQREVFANLARQVARGKLNLALQDFQQTNRQLESNKIPYETLLRMDKAQIARKLGVDAVIWGIGDVFVDFRGFQPGGVEAVMFIYDARTGQEVWRQESSQRPTTPRSTPEQLMSSTFNGLSARLPYRGL